MDRRKLALIEELMAYDPGLLSPDALMMLQQQNPDLMAPAQSSSMEAGAPMPGKEIAPNMLSAQPALVDPALARSNMQAISGQEQRRALIEALSE